MYGQRRTGIFTPVAGWQGIEKEANIDAEQRKRKSSRPSAEFARRF
jgi:hypothetical protein